MKYESWNIAVEGQKTGEAVLHGYLLDAISVAPEKKRPAVIVCAGGGYARRSDREAEPVILQFLSMGYHGFLLDYSVAPNRFPTSVRELALAVSMVREHAEEWHGSGKDLCLWIFRSRTSLLQFRRVLESGIRIWSYWQNTGSDPAIWFDSLLSGDHRWRGCPQRFF